MTDQRGRFHPSELGIPLDAESAELLATARDLEAYAHAGTVMPTPGFEDRVMAAIADEPMPRPSTRRGFVAFVKDSWAAAFGAGRPLAVRAQGLALLVLLAVAVGSVGSVVAVGASRLLAPPAPTPPSVVPSPSPDPSPTPAPSLSPSPTPSPSATPSVTVSPTATETDEPSGIDDHGGGSGSGSDDSGASGSNSGPGGGSGSDDSRSSSGKGSGGSGSDD